MINYEFASCLRFTRPAKRNFTIPEGHTKVAYFRSIFCTVFYALLQVFTPLSTISALCPIFRGVQQIAIEPYFCDSKTGNLRSCCLNWVKIWEPTLLPIFRQVQTPSLTEVVHNFLHHSILPKVMKAFPPGSRAKIGYAQGAVPQKGWQQTMYRTTV